MRVLHLCPAELSGAPSRLVQVQRLSGLEARQIYFLDPARGDSGYPRDLLTTDPPELLAEVARQAEVVHYHNVRRENWVFKVLPWIRDLVWRKPSVIQYHSPREGNGFEEDLRDPFPVKLVVAQHQVRLYPECRPVRNAMPIDDPLHLPAWIRNDPPVVAFTPGGCHGKGWYSKGCEETLPILRGYHHRFITGLPWPQAMEARRQCDIAIDEIVNGGYHQCSLESMSQGLATIAGLDAQTVDVLERVTGTREHPWIVARPETLDRELRRLVSDPAYLEAKRREARLYMERHWAPEVVTRDYTAAYAEALERADSSSR
jgi:hypothetical protein